MSKKLAFIGTVATLALVIGAGGLPAVGKGSNGWTKVVKDSKETGKLYEAATYKRCDITKVEAKVAGKTLIVKVTHRGKQVTSTGAPFPNTDLNLNTKGGKKSDPEYRVDGQGGLTKRSDNSFKADVAKVKLADGKKAVQWQLPLKKIGKPKKVGFQAKTCGEGAVDIAPGGNYFDDTSWDGTIPNKFTTIKTRN